MDRYVYNGDGWINLEKVDVAIPSENDRWTLTDQDGKVLDANFPDFLGTIVRHLPVQGTWEVLMTGDADLIVVDPVLAWGVRVDGTLVPVTPSEPGGVQGAWVVRDMQRPDRVFGYGCGLGGMTHSEWLRKNLAEGDVEGK